MGNLLVIKDADFSENAIGKVGIEVTIEQGIIDLVLSEAAYGDYLRYSTASLKRMRVVNTGLIYIEQGQEFSLSGLQGVGNVETLRVDAGIYSSPSPSHSTILHTLNGDSTSYYKFNTEGNDSLTLTAPYTGYYAFCFAGQTMQEVISPSNYNILLSITG